MYKKMVKMNLAVTICNGYNFHSYLQDAKRCFFHRYCVDLLETQIDGEVLVIGKIECRAWTSSNKVVHVLAHRQDIPFVQVNASGILN